LVEWFQTHASGIPVVALGYHNFTMTSDKDLAKGWHPFSFKLWAKPWQAAKTQIGNRQFVVVTASNENWGLLSTWFPNRTCNWGSMENKLGELNLALKFLDEPQLKFWYHMQHTNITHPKILTMPLGMYKTPAKMSLNEKVRHETTVRTKKTKWVGMYGNRRGFRLWVHTTLTRALGDELIGNARDLGYDGYLESVQTVRFSVCPSGLGVDCYCIWETQLRRGSNCGAGVRARSSSCTGPCPLG